MQESTDCYENLLELFIKLDVIQSDTQKYEDVRTVISKMKTEQQVAGKSLHYFDFGKFVWHLDFDVLRNSLENIPDLDLDKARDQLD